MKKLIIISIIVLILGVAIVYYKNDKELQGLEEEFDEEIIFVKDDNGNERQIKLRCSGWFAPYDENGRTNLNKLTKKRFGVYFIRSKRTGEIIYIGHSRSNLYKALYRHFQYYNDTDKQLRNYYAQKHNYEVKVCLTYKKDAYDVERYFIFLYEPRDAFFKYAEFISDTEQIKIPVENNETWEVVPAEEVPF